VTHLAHWKARDYALCSDATMTVGTRGTLVGDDPEPATVCPRCRMVLMRLTRGVLGHSGGLMFTR
jgi:hypothetical protein